ncbi:cupin domain-containing protein [Blastococcus sp. SYSU D00695]
MSHIDPRHVDPGHVDLRAVADHPMTATGAGALRMVAPGAVTAGRYGLVEYRLAPRSPGAAPHYHRTFSESFYVLSGELTVYAGDRWRPCGAGDLAIAHERGVHGFRNDSAEPATFLILFTPGIAREEFFAELAELRRSGRRPTPEEMTAFYARHDQVMVDV